MVAEMQTPSQTVPLELIPDQDEAGRSGLIPEESLQKVVRFDLREEGSHVLAVSVSYSENILSKSASSASGGRVRSFRKLYQFAAQPCLSVRTKASVLPLPETSNDQRLLAKRSRYALEAQLENLADGLITLENLTFDAKSPFKSTSLNWDIPNLDSKRATAPTLAPREVTQVAFVLDEGYEPGDTPKEYTKDNRVILGVLTIQWRSAFGDPGVLSTGWLTSRRI
ncbi:hypothetical protein MMC30_003291 [Trapelia coarctata]|nr:hypothetical protein [Trapelia coarctata]